MTEGEYRVGIGFNPGKNPAVDRIKAAAANLIDLIDDIQGADESDAPRCKALAMTHIEDGAMWAVKAITKEPRED